MNVEGLGAIGPADFPAIGDYPFGILELVDVGVNGSGRSPNADTINLYYVRDYEDEELLGGTFSPSAQPVVMTTLASVRDDRGNATVAHELGHMLFNGPVAHEPIMSDPVHSNDTSNLMYPFSSTDPRHPPGRRAAHGAVRRERRPRTESDRTAALQPRRPEPKLHQARQQRIHRR